MSEVGAVARVLVRKTDGTYDGSMGGGNLGIVAS